MLDDLYNLRSNSPGICPVTGLSILKKSEWSDISLADDYSVSFRLIGSKILYTLPIGIPSDTGVHKVLDERERVLREANLFGKEYVEIRDFGLLTVNPSKEGRMTLTNMLIKETNEGNLLGFWGINSPIYIRWMFNVGVKLHKPVVPVVVVKDYKTAAKNALNMLKQKGISLDVKELMRFSKDDWNIRFDDYEVSFELIGNDIIYTNSSGVFQEAYIQEFFSLHNKILEELGLNKGGSFYSVLNWEKIEKTDWKTRKISYGWRLCKNCQNI